VGASVLVVVLLCAPAAFPVHREPVGQLAPAGRSLSLPATKAPTSAASPGAAGGYRSAEGAASGTSPSVQTFDLRNNTLVNGSVAFPNCLAPGGAGVPSVGALVPAGADEHVFISCQTSDTVVVLSEANRSVLRILPVGAYPSGMAFDNSTGEVFVANFQSNNVSVISTSNLTVVRSIAVGLRPLTVTLDAGARELLVRNVGSDSISVIADQNDTVTTTVTVGGLSVGAVYDAARGEAYFTGVFLGYPQGSVSVFSDATNTIVAQILVGLDPDELVLDNATGELYVSNSASDNVTVIDLASRTVVAATAVGTSPGDMAFDWKTGEIYVSNVGSDNVSVLSGATHQVVANVTVGSYPGDILYDARTQDVYVANNNATNLTLLLAGTTTTGSLSVGTGPIWLAESSSAPEVIVACDSDQISIVSDLNTSVNVTFSVGQSPMGLAYVPTTNATWVTDGPEARLLVVAGTPPRVGGRSPAGPAPTAVLYDPSTDEIYVAFSGLAEVGVYMPGSGEQFAYVPVGSDPVALAYDNRTGDVLVANFGSSNVTVISDRTVTALTSIAVPADPEAVVADPSSGKWYVGAWDSGNVSVYSDTNYSQIAQVPVGLSVIGLADDGAHGEVYAASQGDGNVSVISTSTDRVLATIALNDTLTAITVDAGSGDIAVAALSDRVFVISAANRSVLSTVNVGVFPDALAIDGRTGDLLVADQASGTLSIISDWLSPAEYTVSFTESGLPMATVWGVVLDGRTNSSLSDLVTFPGVTNGTYTYQIGGVPGFVTFWSGQVNVHGSDATVTVAFQVTVYRVTFVEQGLPAGSAWTVTLGGALSGSSTSQIGFADLPNGTYDWTVGAVPGFHTTWVGSVVLSGGPASVTVPFVPTVYSVTFTELGLADGASWTVHLAGATLVTARPAITFYNVPNGSYAWSIGPVPGYQTNWSGVESVNGPPAVVPVRFTIVTYALTFHEFGLPSGTNWSVTLGGSVAWATTDLIEFEEPNGSYPFSVAPTAAEAGGSGTVLVAGGPMVQNVTYAAPSTGVPLLWIAVGAVGVVAVVGAGLWAVRRRRGPTAEVGE